MMRRTFTVLAAALVLSGPLAACGVESSTAQKTGQANSSDVAQATSAPVKGTRENPFALNDVITLKDRDNGNFDVVATSFQPNGTTEVLAANRFNSAPKEGNEYALVGLSFTYHAGVKKQTAEVGVMGAVLLSVFGQSAVEVKSTSCVASLGPAEIDTMAALLDGGTVAGKECFQMSAADLTGPVLLRVSEAFCFSNCDEGWIKLQ